MEAEYATNQNPFSFVKLSDPFSVEAARHGVDPATPIKGVQVEFRDKSVNEAFKRYITQDFTTIRNIAQINPRLTDLYRKLQKARIYNNLGVNLEPGKEVDTIKIVFEPSKKNRFFGSFDQQISKDGSYVQEAKVTVRNVLGFMDLLSLEIGKGWGGNIIENYHLKYTLPIFYKDYSMELSFEKAFRDLIPTVREEAASKSVTIFNDAGYIKISDVLKMNFVDLIQHSKPTLAQEIFPLRRISLKAGRVWSDIYEIDKEYGRRTEMSGEIGAGKGGAPFVRLEFNNHSFFNPRELEYKKKIKHINFENYFSAGLTVPLSRSRLRMNDRFFSYSIRGFGEVANIDHPYDKALHPEAGNQGFEKLGDYTGDDTFLKNTIKVNFNRFPYLRQGGLVPFLYYSCAYLSGNIMNKRLESGSHVNLLNELKNNTRHSFGVGLAKSFGEVKLEILLNMFAKGRTTDRFARFQLRLAVND